MSNMDQRWLASLTQMLQSQEDVLPMMEAFLESVHKRNKCGNSLAIKNFSKELDPLPNNGITIPTYQDIYCAPKKCARDGKKLYGKKLLEVYFKDQHILQLANYREVRSWFKDYIKPNDLRHNKQEQQKVQCIIEENHHKVKALKFQGVEYIWRQDDIYRWWLSSNQGSRKYTKRKSNMSTSLLIAAPNHAEDKAASSDNTNLDNCKALENECNDISSNNQDIEDGHTTKIQCDNVALPNVFLDMDTENEKECDLSEDEFYDDVLNGTQFPCFKDLLEHGFSKRVKAMQNPTNEVFLSLHSMEESNMVTPIDALKTIQMKNPTRKSCRERKISEKMQTHMGVKNKKKNSTDKDKKIKVMKPILDSSENSNDNGVIMIKEHNVSIFTMEEMETILLKYFEVQTVEQMYMVLKSTYHKIRKENSFKDVKAQSLDEMRESLVSWLMSNNRVKINRKFSHDLSVEDVEIEA